MKIVVINGTEVKGCTYRMKELFLENLRNGNDIIEFYLPKDMPKFCSGCKTCFLKSELLCPHAEYVMPIWNAILDAELIVFAYPVYVLRTPGQVKALLDHFACHWMVHRPDKKMFGKRAVVITQSIGAPNGAAQKDIETSLTWLGVSDVKKFGFGTMGAVKWDEINDKRRKRVEYKLRKFSKQYLLPKPVSKNIKVRMFFFISKMLHKNLLKTEDIISADTQHWIDSGWIKR
ncbi:flavodoxin family protein [Tepidimicrobium xylanilyticum]|nr:NAD(P)H-dependent oxidoreductase [Tepidimicrobium xylanilyticum]GMG96520.1 flavin reductase [Tepidimicrobium xylanilyticum]